MKTRKTSPTAAGTEDIIWSIGFFEFPGQVTEGDEVFHPEVLIVLDPQGCVIDMVMERPGVVLHQIAKLLDSAMRETAIGRSHQPSRIRVASQKLADHVRRAMPQLAVVVGPTPEVDEVILALRAKHSQSQAERRSYFEQNLSADQLALFFRACAGLYRAKPWKVAPSDQHVVVFSIDKVGIKNAVLSIIGQNQESYGLLVFNSVDDFAKHLVLTKAIERGESPPLIPHIGLNFDRASELSETMREEIREHAWEIATSRAYPWILKIASDWTVQPATSTELLMFEALALALPNMLLHKKTLTAAWGGAIDFELTEQVHTHEGKFKVRLIAKAIQDQPGVIETKAPDSRVEPRPAKKSKKTPRLH